MRSSFIALMLLIAGCGMFGSSAPAISQQELLEQMKADADILILDVRTDGEFKAGHIPGAFHIDHQQIESRIHEITAYRNKPVIVYCLSGMRAGMVEAYLIKQGFTQVKHLEGDWSAWSSNSLPSE